MNLTIRAKLSIIFLGFLVLVAGAVAATFLAVERQATDALVVSLAVRQRVLVHGIARAVVGLQTHSQRDEYYLNLIELDRASGQFGRVQDTMLLGGALAEGIQGEMVELPAATAPDVREQLRRIQALWQPMQAAANVLLGGADGAEKSRAISEITFKTPLIYSQIDLLIQMLEADAAHNLALLKSIQIVFFLSAVGLLAGGYAFVKRAILKPLGELDNAVRQIASGDLSKTISIGQRDEIGALGRSFESMRQEVAAARRTSEAWTVELESRVEQRTQELAALLGISADISSKLDADRVLSSVVDTGRKLLGGEVAVLCLLNGSPRNLSVASSSGPSAAIIRSQARVDQGLAEEVIEHGQTVTCDVCDACPILAPAYLQEQIVAPLRAGDHTLGALCVAYPGVGQFGDDAARLLTFLANSAAIALENARLYNRVQASATLAERERIAAEMHDGLAQTMGYLNLQVSQALNLIDEDDPAAARKYLQLMQPAIQTAYSTVRQALVGLSDNSFTQRGFKAQLETYLDDFRQNCSAKVQVVLDESCLATIPEKAQPQLLRIVQECLTNIRRHAVATRVEVSVKREESSVVLTITDDGRGFDPAALPDDGQPHLGLKIMRGRIERVGGSLMIQSRPGSGTRIMANAPLCIPRQL